ncbi:MAG: hypothetical protein K5750_06545 [Eubacterium sp.]|nr:hypothetical protein [Eubacterium sp.]
MRNKKNESRENVTGEEKRTEDNEIKKGLYNNDYSPKFSEPYNIYDKAREHMKKLRKEKNEQED